MKHQVVFLISAINISSASVEVSSGPQPVTVILQTTDDEDGFTEGFFS